MNLQTIYLYNNEFDKEQIIKKVNDISEQIQSEEEKMLDTDYDKEKIRRLMYEQFFQGLKLSIR